jgi:hypothetical protein
MGQDWITQVKTRGMTNAVNIALDVLEPFGPLAAQMLFVLQPTFGIFGLKSAVEDIAQALDQPGGIETLRQRLKDEDVQP